MSYFEGGHRFSPSYSLDEAEKNYSIADVPYENMADCFSLDHLSASFTVGFSVVITVNIVEVFIFTVYGQKLYAPDCSIYLDRSLFITLVHGLVYKLLF